jgi:methionyl-tRNA formyltransferase
MKIVFFGTPQFAALELEYLLENKVEVAAIVTQPDRPKGRSLQMTPSAVKTLSLAKAPNIPLLQPEKASGETFLNELAALKADLFVVVAYGQILSQRLLDIPHLGCINVHASLLPKLRGAAPIQRAILTGERETGIAIQKMVKQLDAGDVIAVAKTPIGENQTAGELEKILNDLSKPLLLRVIREYEKGVPKATPQDAALVTYAPKIELAEGEIFWNRPAIEVHHLVCAFSPRPGAWCWVETQGERKKLKILRSRVATGNGIPGKILAPETVACKEGALHLLEVQPEGKKVMPASDWFRGQRIVSF